MIYITSNGVTLWSTTDTSINGYRQAKAMFEQLSRTHPNVQCNKDLSWVN
ncbi:hypothetical protein IJG21_02185 [Candidatus Saccharibacteria bacterium]|nr:hypothetical protein [Candidatus Saccharibacteria bacterium]